MDPTIIAAFLVGVIGPAVGVLLGWARERRKTQAGAQRDVAEAKHAEVEGEVSVAAVVLRWSEGLRDELTKVKTEVEGLKAQIANLERQNRALRRHNEILTAQVIGLGGTPRAMPED